MGLGICGDKKHKQISLPNTRRLGSYDHQMGPCRVFLWGFRLPSSVLLKGFQSLELEAQGKLTDLGPRAWGLGFWI